MNQCRKCHCNLSHLEEFAGVCVVCDDSFTCIECGNRFKSLAPPAETRPDDPEPMCLDCIDKMLDSIPCEPMSEEQVTRIMAKAFPEGTPKGGDA